MRFITGGKHTLSPVSKGGNMSLDKKLTVLLILTIAFFAIFFGIVILGSVLPELQPVCVWIAIGVAVLYIAASLIFVLIARKKDKQKFDDME